MRNLLGKPTRIAVLGNPVRDAYLDVDAITFPEQRVRFRSRGDQAEQFDLAYQGDAIRFGEKRYAQCDLSTLNLAAFTVRNGGGVFHTGTQLARLCVQRRLPVALTAIDLVQPWPELVEAYTQLGIAHCSLGLTAPATNLVLTNGKPDRLILKSPDPATPLSPIQAERLRALLPARLDLLVVNSLRSADLARIVMRHAQQVGAAQYSVLTPSLALEARVILQLQRDRASVCNLAEFVQIAQAFGIPCPSQEENAAIADVVAAMLALGRQGKTGDLVVTLGARGCLTADRTTGKVVHVALRDGVAPRVQEQVLAHPERKNGVGDRFFGSFVLAHVLMKLGCHNRTAEAAHWASLEMVRQLAPTLTPERHWVVAQPLAHGFGAQQGQQLRNEQSEKTILLPKWLPAPAVALS
ncbi:MAG: hypothetical protein DYG89_34030 [Caldilinea sp. CFX5]|nr:hypothetical protein [Caldilinea sp. CFX5]